MQFIKKASIEKVLPRHTVAGKLARYVWRFFYRIFNKVLKKNNEKPKVLIANINRDMTKQQKRVLISYITSPLLQMGDDMHTNRSEACQILHYFASRGFIVDLIRFDDTQNIPAIEKLKYDFIFGFGEVFYHMTRKFPDVNNCIYMTENLPDFSSEKEKERIDYFYQRHGIKISHSRSGTSYKDKHLKYVKNAIVKGIPELYEKYGYRKLFTIKTTGLRNGSFIEHCPITDDSKKSFLWFGSYGAVHKGLDILIDIAERNSDFNLHICGLSRAEEHLFTETISKCTNIHDHGFVNINSPEFIDIVNSVTFMVLPSCSEGSSGACSTVARHGVLLLLLLRSSGMDYYGNHAFWLDDFKVDYVEKRMREVSALDNEFLMRKSRELQEYADREFCLENFTKTFEKAMDEILNE